MVGVGRARAGGATTRTACGRCSTTPSACAQGVPLPPSISELELTPVRLPGPSPGTRWARSWAARGTFRSRGPRPPRARQVDDRPARNAAGQAAGRARSRTQPGDTREVLAVLALLQRRRRRRRPVRRWHLGGRRVRPETAQFAGVVALDLRRLNGLAGRSTMSRAGGPGTGATGTRGRGAPGAARLHHRPFPPVVAVRDPRRVRRGALERPGVSRLRPLRRPCAGTPGGDAGGHAGLGGHPSPRPAPICASSCSAPRAPSG